jgi:ribosomal protein L39E
MALHSAWSMLQGLNLKKRLAKKCRKNSRKPVFEHAYPVDFNPHHITRPQVAGWRQTHAGGRTA